MKEVRVVKHPFPAAAKTHRENNWANKVRTRIQLYRCLLNLKVTQPVGELPSGQRADWPQLHSAKIHRENNWANKVRTRIQLYRRSLNLKVTQPVGELPSGQRADWPQLHFCPESRAAAAQWRRTAVGGASAEGCWTAQRRDTWRRAQLAPWPRPAAAWTSAGCSTVNIPAIINRCHSLSHRKKTQAGPTLLAPKRKWMLVFFNAVMPSLGDIAGARFSLNTKCTPFFSWLPPPQIQSIQIYPHPPPKYKTHTVKKNCLHI